MNAAPEWVTPLLTAIGGALAGGLALRRRLSSDRVANKEDETRIGLISRLQHERDEAVEEAQRERQQRTEDARTIASLTADNIHLRADVQRLEKAMRRMARGLSEEVRAVFQETGLGDLK